jgi:hypothetical protein
MNTPPGRMYTPTWLKYSSPWRMYTPTCVPVLTCALHGPMNTPELWPRVYTLVSLKEIGNFLVAMPRKNRARFFA